MTLYTQDIKHACALAGEAYARTLAKTQEAILVLRTHREDGSWPILSLPERSDDLRTIEETAARIRDTFSTLVVVGIGGSSLGGRALVSLAGNPFAASKTRIHFLENIDPFTSDQLLATLDFKTTFFLFISKSGDTAETLAHAFIILAQLRSRLGKNAVRDHALVITEPKNNALSRLAKSEGIPMLAHDAIGGRYAALTVVGLLPAAIAGLNIRAMRGGAQAVLTRTLSLPESEAVQGAALTAALASQGRSVNVLMPYCDRLSPFGSWYCQLAGESLGKEGKGITPVRAVGAIDQHSQLQLYLDGPRDKLITFILLAQAGKGAIIAPPDDPSLAYLRNHKLGDLMDAEQRATVAALARNNCPARTLTLGQLDEETIGALMMHFMLEVMITARLMGVNAFDQPAVEEGKHLARQYLGAMQ